MTTASTAADRQGTPPWQDATLSSAERVEALLQEMTLEEKVAQLGSRWVGNDMQAEASTQPTLRPIRVHLQRRSSAGRVRGRGTISLEDASMHGLGHLTRVFGSHPMTVAEGTAELVRQHHVVLEGSRLGIPALVHEECLTGFTTFGATVYPAAIAWGATFDADLVERMAAAIGRDMAAVGVHQGLSPVLDVVRDYRWGRVEETIGEDPYLVAMLGSAYVRGLQSAGVIATLKHFAGYSASRAARNHGPVSMGRRELLDVILPPFEMALALAGAGSVMNSYSDIDGVPAGGDPWLLTEVLRDEWGFEGTVVSDYWAVPFLASMHRVAADTDAAGAMALSAGIDVELPDTLGFGHGLVERVRSGELAEELVDRAARRLLTQKVQLGLLDADWTPEGSVGDALTRSRLGGQPRTCPGDGREVGRAARRRHGAPTARGRAPGAPKRGRGGAVFRRPAHVHGVLRVPQPRVAALPGCGPRRGGADRVSTHCGPSSRTSTWFTKKAARCREPTGRASPQRSPPPVRQTCVSPSSGTSPACSDSAPRAKAATPRTSGSRACRPTCSPSSWRRARRWSSSLSPDVPTRSGDVHGRAAGLVQAFMPGEEGGVGHRGRPLGSGPARRQAARADPEARRRAAEHLPPAGTRRRRERRHQQRSTRRRCSRSATARRTPPSRSTTCGSAPPRCPPTGSSPSPCGSATPARGPATRWSSSTCTTSLPRWPGR